MTTSMHRCPSCENQFMQPFVCTTCGAAKLHDAELRSAHARIAEAERLLRIAYVTIGGKPIELGAALRWQADVDAWRGADSAGEGQ